MNILQAGSTKQATQQERYEKTRTLVRDDSAAASIELAGDVAQLVRERQAENRNLVLGLATGSTPVPFYRELIRLHRDEGLSFKNVITFNLDEYYGLLPDHPESYYRFMHDQLFDQIDIPREQIHIPDGTVPLDEVYDWCHRYEEAIREAGGLDLQILGIGRTGHIGFNEPGSAEDSRTRMITLDRVTRQDAAPDFLGQANVPRSAITMGVGTILDAASLVLMAWGSNKAEIVREAVEGAVTDQVSASFLQLHENATFLVDAAAAARLTRFQHPWLVGSVEWDGAMKKRAVSWLSSKLEKPILKLVDEDYNEAGVGELLASTERDSYEINIEVFNQVQLTITGWPGGKPNADDSNRPERATPFPKKALILSPEPADVFIGMGGTVARLIQQEHEVRLVFQTSGNLRVADVAAQNFASVLLEMAEGSEGQNWQSQREYGDSIIEALEEKGEFGIDPKLVRLLKGFILRGEARDAGRACKVNDDHMQFLDLPFYESGRYRRFHLGDADVDAVGRLLDLKNPDVIFATGDAADPSSVQALSYRAVASAVAQRREAGKLTDTTVWLYRGRDQPLETHEIDMAVPMSPDQLAEKREAIRKFNSTSDDELSATDRNQGIASDYDALGMAEYESIEAFRRG
ncbi:MAG: glucosamine-6-phosphate deaminase [Verrucomicrobiota bacterium]